MNEEQIITLTECDQRSRSNTHRLDKLEQNYEALNRLTVSVETMGVKLGNPDKTMQKLDARMEEQESKPGKRWDGLVTTLIGVIVGAVMAVVFSHIGLN
jgi:hypothetical protein